MEFRLSEIARITNGQLIGQDRDVIGLSTDTRKLQENNLFVSLIGEKFDPHKLIEEGKVDHAGAVVVERKVESKVAQIVVKNSYKALQEIARAWRNKFSLPVIGITGSNGKTSVKELIKQILTTQGKVLATVGNLNNHIGVPLTLVNLNESHQYAIIEMGANHPGEIANLTQLVKPDIGVITNIGPAHLEGFGSIEGVAKAKAELYRHLNPQGIAVVNIDQPYQAFWEKDIGDRIQISFGIEQKADISVKMIDLDLVDITTPMGEIRVQLQALGQHAIYNALAATAVGIGLGIDVESIREGLEATKPVPGRLVRLKGIGGSSILDDTYNANPASLSVALDAQAQLSGEHWLVLGDMGELGSDSVRLHAQAGEMAKEYGIKRLFGLGELSKYAVKAFGAGATHYLNHSEVIEALQNDLYKEICVLVKGSRAMRLEKIIERIQTNLNSETACNEYVA